MSESTRFVNKRYRAFEYRVFKSIQVTDGDTIRFDIDLGFNVIREGVIVRIVGINAPDKSDPIEKAAAIAVTKYVQHLVDTASFVALTSQEQTEKYGRYLGSLCLAVGYGAIDLREHLIAKKFAKAWDGKGSRPIFDAHECITICKEVEAA